MSLLGPLIGGAISLFGASKQAKAQKEANYNNSPQGIRANSEAAGFNPMVFAGPGTITQYAPQMGNALMDIGGLIQDGFTEAEQLKLQKAELEQENQRLTKQASEARLRPEQPGIYAANGRSTAVTGTSKVAGKGQVAPSVMSQSPAQPQSYVEPGSGLKTSVLADDGLTMANPDAPPELETDAWMWARQGTVVPNGLEVWERNEKAIVDDVLWPAARAVTPMPRLGQINADTFGVDGEEYDAVFGEAKREWEDKKRKRLEKHEEHRKKRQKMKDFAKQHPNYFN